MREILFRGKRTDNGEWIYGSYLCRTNPCIECFEFAHDGVPEPYIFEVIPETVGQYTGLKDKNGLKIFDGDILSAERDGEQEYLFMVKFGACGGVQNVDHAVGYIGYYVEGADNQTRDVMRYGTRNDIIYFLNEYECAVVGNIHDASELLKK